MTFSDLPLTPRERLAAARRRVRSAVLARRRLLAALLAAAAVGLGLRAVSAPPPASETVTVAAHDLPAGATLTPDDLTTVEQVPGTAPPGALAAPEGEVLAGPVGAGEAITSARLVGAGLASEAGTTAVPVRLPDAGTAALLDVGDRIDLLASASGGVGGGTATADASALSTVVAADVTVLALPTGDGATGMSASGPAGATGGRVVVLGVPETQVTHVVDAAARAFLSYAWSG
ncbi:SAF domain-containing protein [Nocardioides bruguierae]|uniref:SAF domain-containing protein n=1 Tax=Nocardioides bruguierae TaxID=2945102 RepID=UPI00202234BE|nr:SAF domain-containing protein [Nocardioides bruguierae]MCL8026844.1 RcpC/CpaB family pilus assembly protein [Nocardioides bruguierae]